MHITGHLEESPLRADRRPRSIVGTAFTPPDEAVASLRELLTNELPVPSDPSDLSWVRHRSAEALFRWAAATVGPDAALGAVRYLLDRVSQDGLGDVDPGLVVARLRRHAARWTTGSSRSMRRHELPVPTVWNATKDLVATVCVTLDPLDALPGWLAGATGQTLTAAAGDRLVTCATIAVDLAAEDDRRPRASRSPIGGVLRRRLADQLEPPLDCPVARRSIARLLLGPTGRPDDGTLSRFANRERPELVPVAVRASWAADVLDLDATLLGERSRPLAREAVRRSVVHGSILPACVRPTERRQLAAAG